MTDVAAGAPETIVGLSFDDPFRAQEFLTATQRLVAQHHVRLVDAVIVVKTANGQTHVRETTDPGPTQSALTGGMWAGLFGLILGGPVGWLAGTAVGAGAGAIRAKVVDIGVPDEWVDWFKEAVQPDTTTVVLLLADVDRGVVLEELQRFSGARLVYANVEPDMVQRIRDAIGDPATGPLTQGDDEAPPTEPGPAEVAEGDALPPPAVPPSEMPPSDVRSTDLPPSESRASDES